MSNLGTKQNQVSHDQYRSNSKESTYASRPSPQTTGNRAMRRLFSADSSPHSSRDDRVEIASSDAVMLTLSGHGMSHPVAESMRRPSVRFRVPTFDKLKGAYTDKDLKIPEAVIKSRVTQLLQRMKKEGRLKSTDSVATIVGKIFPSPGKIDEAEFNKAIDVADRSRIYRSVAEAETQVKAADKPKLKTAMGEAADLAKKVQSDAAGLKQVFGTKDATAKTNYQNAEKALRDLPSKMDTEVTTDYNLDDEEVGLGGWASNADKKMHLLLAIAQVKDIKETKATLIHEASHFGSASVDDHVYYDDDGFFELEEDKKVANAAHYEELPRREMGNSKFDKKTFVPGTKPSGGAVTKEDKIKAAAKLYLRKAWDCGVDAHMFIRGVRREYEKGNIKPFNDNKALIMEISKLMDLTIHEQAAGKAVVTTLDVTLSESISRGVAIVGSNAKSVPFPAPGSLTDLELRNKIISEAVKLYDNLLKDPARDKKLLDWLESHYRSLPSI
jgi:hypothetical protein